MKRGIIIALGAAALALAGGLAGAQQRLPDLTQHVDYSIKQNWLCFPGQADWCTQDLGTTVVEANGRVHGEVFIPDPDAPIDCFYVYPTASRDPGAVSDLFPQEDQEGRVARTQFERLGAKCRLFAPMYRSITLAGIGRPRPGDAPVDRSALPPADQRAFDALDAWNWYMAHENKGRGVVILGHSQGAGVITRMIAEAIDGKPAQKQLISAIILGTSFQVPKGKDVGGTFKSIPLCHSASQFGCVLTWSDYRDTFPPAANALFGADRGGMEAACTNPANLSGGVGVPKSYWSAGAVDWVKGKTITTPFVSTPGLVTTECVARNGHHYLQVHVNAKPNDPRTDQIEGDVMTNGQPDAGWGLHLIDANIAMGNMLDIVEQQGRAWRKANGQ